MLMGVALVVTLIGFNLSEPGLGAPPHCDRKGYPSCFDAGFQDGQANPGTRCPSGHSIKFCNGWNAGANTGGSNSKIQNIQQKSSLPSNAKTNQDNVSIFIVLFLLIAGLIAIKLRKRGGKSKERKGFPQYVKENILRKQDHKCANCKRLLNVVDWDHKNGDRSDNREKNCQALCPTCHAIKTRRGQSKR
jgi:hypothetical protein